MKMWQLLLFIGTAISTGVIFRYHREIEFRKIFGIWPREIGVDKIVSRRLREIDDEYAKARNRAADAKRKFDNCLCFVDVVRRTGKTLRHANRTCNNLNSYYRRAAALANRFGFQDEVKQIGEAPPSEFKLRAIA